MPRTGRQNRARQAPPAESREDKEVLETNLTGRVKRYDAARSYGFVTRDDNGEDLFMHKSSIWRFDLEPGVEPYFDEGQIVCFDLARGRKGLEALNVTELTNLPTRDPRWRINNPLQPRHENVVIGGIWTESRASSNTNGARGASANAANNTSESGQSRGSRDESPLPDIPAYLAGLEDVSSGDEHYYMMGYQSSNDEEEFDPDREVSYPQFVRYYTDLKRANRLRAEEEAKNAQTEPAKAPEAAQPAPATASALASKEPVEEESTFICQFCLEEPPAIVYDPCKHTIHCVDCAYRVNLCPKCNTRVTKKHHLDGRELKVDKTAKISQLVERVEEIDRAITCQICFARKWDCVFQCGHSLCEQCAKTQENCPFCRKVIKRRTKLY